jgi:hypothetical protein
MKKAQTIKIVTISDVHLQWEKLKIPDCDILISAGDYGLKGHTRVYDYHEWLAGQPAKVVLSIFGNNEKYRKIYFDSKKPEIEDIAPGIIHFISDGPVNIENLKIYCLSWASLDPNSQQARFPSIPQDTQILITHEPPYGILDFSESDGRHVGSRALLERIKQLPDLMLHIYGHAHGSHGECDLRFPGTNLIHFANASMCDESHQNIIHRPIEIDLALPERGPPTPLRAYAGNPAIR